MSAMHDRNRPPGVAGLPLNGMTLTSEVRRAADLFGDGTDLAVADPDFTDALQVHEFLLEITRRHYASGNVNAFVSRFHLPQRIGTFHGTRILTTAQDVREMFYDVRRSQMSRGVTDMVRICIAARFVTPSEVRATHMTYLMSGMKLVQEPWPSHGTLQRVRGRWQVACSEYGIDDKGLAHALTPAQVAHSTPPALTLSLPRSAAGADPTLGAPTTPAQVAASTPPELTLTPPPADTAAAPEDTEQDLGK